MKNLIKVRLRRIKNTIKHTGRRKYIIFSILGLSIILLLVFLFTRIFGYLYMQKEFPLYFKLFLSEKILMMFFLTMFIMLILSALISSLNIFFLSKDLNLLFASPLKARTIFYWKSVEVSFNSSIMVIFFSLPVLFSYSYYFAYSFSDITGIVFVFLLYILCGVSVGIIIGLIVPAFFSVKKLQPILSIISIVLISLIVIFLRMLRPEQFGNPDVINNLFEYMNELNVKNFSYFPFYWISRSLNFIAQGNTAGYWKTIGLFIGFTFLIGSLIWLFQNKFYLKLFDKLNKGSDRGIRSNWKKKLFKADFGSLWKKEIKTFIRTPSQWSQLLIIGAIVAVFILNMKGIPLPHPSVKNIIAYINLGMAAFIVVGLNSRFTFTTIPMENPGLVHLLSSPFNKKKIFHFKFLFFLIPHLLLGFILFFTGDFALKLDPFTRLNGTIFLLLTIPFLTVFALYSSLQIKDTAPLTPQHLIVSKQGISYMLWSLVYIVLNMIFFVRPLFLYYYNKYTKQPIPVFEIIMWFLVFVCINLFLTANFYKKSTSLWNKREFL